MHRLVLSVACLLASHVGRAAVNFPGVEYNAALGEPAMASSHYAFAPNALLDTTFVPQNAVDGFPDSSSWWASGDANDSAPFWQVNLSAPVPRVARVVVRWHGFQAPASYRLRVSYNGDVFSTVATVANAPMTFDRVDNVTSGWDKVAAFRYLRVAMDAHTACTSEWTCEGSGVATSTTGERAIYGIRELELWAKGNKNGACACIWTVSVEGLC